MKDSTFCAYLNLLFIVWVIVIVLTAVGICICGSYNTVAGVLMLLDSLGLSVTYLLCEYYDYKVWRSKRNRRNHYYSLQKD